MVKCFCFLWIKSKPTKGKVQTNRFFFGEGTINSTNRPFYFWRKLQKVIIVKKVHDLRDQQDQSDQIMWSKFSSDGRDQSEQDHHYNQREHCVKKKKLLVFVRCSKTKSTWKLVLFFMFVKNHEICRFSKIWKLKCQNNKNVFLLWVLKYKLA